MSDPWEDELLYDLKNPPVMSMVVSRDDLYTIMATRMGKAADEIDRLRAENERLREALGAIKRLGLSWSDSFEYQAYEARRIARAALAKETGE